MGPSSDDARGRATPHPIATETEPVKLTGAGESVPKTMIWCTEDDLPMPGGEEASATCRSALLSRVAVALRCYPCPRFNDICPPDLTAKEMTRFMLKALSAITLCSSSKFYADVKKLAEDLRSLGVTVYTPRFDYSEEDREVSAAEKAHLTKEFFGKISCSSHIYVMATHGYTGVSVCLEVGYAYALGKVVLASEPVTEFAVAALTSQVLAPDELLREVEAANAH